jgi:hypothetical protein
MVIDVFISYSRNDSQAAEAVERRLQASGLSCYRDTKLTPGTPAWEEEIGRALGECAVVVLLLSPSSAASRFVRRELALADDDGKGCVPVHLARDLLLPAGIRLRLATHQRLHAEPSLEAVLESLERAVVSPRSRARGRGFMIRTCGPRVASSSSARPRRGSSPVCEPRGAAGETA